MLGDMLVGNHLYNANKDVDDDKNLSDQLNEMSGAALVGLLVFLLLIIWFVMIPIMRHVTRTGNGWSVLVGTVLPFPFNLLSFLFERKLPGGSYMESVSGRFL